MGKNLYYCLLVSGCLWSLFSGRVFGEALFIERFDYENGELGAASSNRWAPTTSDARNPNLNVMEGRLVWDFTGPMAEPVNNGYYGATLSQTSINTGKLYAYFDLEVTEAPIGTESTAGIFFTLWNGGGGNRARTFIAAVPDGEGGIVADRFRLGITKQSGSRFDAVYYPLDWAEGTQLTVLVKSDFDAETVTLFVNPETETDTSVVAIDGTFLGIQGVAVRHRDESEPGNNIGVFRVDNIAVTETFGDFEAPPDLPPSRLAVAGVPGGGISVNWTDNSNREAGFRILRKAAGEIEFTPVSMIGTNRTHYLDLDTIPGVEYNYRVIALSDSELISNTSTTARSFDAPGMPAPVMLSLMEARNLAIFTFESEPGVVYEVEESTDLQHWSPTRQLQGDGGGQLAFLLQPGDAGRNFARVASRETSVPSGSIGLTEPFQTPQNNVGSTFNLNDYGATPGNSEDDDALAIQAAFAAMSFGDDLLIGSGDYHLKSTVTVPDGISLKGNLSEVPVFKTMGIDTAFKIDAGRKDVTLWGLSISGEDLMLDYGVFIGEPNGSQVQRVWLNELQIQNFNKRAIQVRSAKHVKIEDCHIQNALQLGGGGFGYGIALNDSNNNNNWVTDCFIGPVIRHGVLIQYSAHNNLIEKNTCFETTEDAYDLHGEDEFGNELRFNLAYWDGDSSTVGSPSGFGVGNTGATHDNSGPGNWIHHNEVRGYQIGIEVIQESHIQFLDNNQLTANADSGIKIHNGSGNSVYIRGNDIEGSKVGIQASRSLGLVIDGNTISGNETGILTTGDIDDYRILENDLRGNGTAKTLGSDAGEYVGNQE